MAKTVKYVPVWRVTYNGTTHYPPRPGETPRTIEGLSSAEIKRLLKMGAIRKLEFDIGAPDEEPNGDPNEGPNGDPNEEPNGDPNEEPNGDPDKEPDGEANEESPDANASGEPVKQARKRK